MYQVQELSGGERPSAGAKDTAIMEAYLSYPFSLSLVVAGSLFYIFIIHSHSTEIVGVFSLLNAIAFLFSTVFSLGLQQGMQHLISYHLGRGRTG